MSAQTVDLAQWGGIIVALISVLGALLGASRTARLALRNYLGQKEADRKYYEEQKEADRKYYEEQKKIDREDEATKNRAKSYKDYLTAYANVQEWPAGGNKVAYVRLYDKYYDAYHNLFQVAVDRVFKATTAFHQIAWLDKIPDEYKERGKHIEEWKKRYAQMLIEMRADAFERTDLSVDEVAQRLPWVWEDQAKANGRAIVPEHSVELRDKE